MYAKSVIHRSWREGVWLLLSLSFYLGFALADGPVLCVDTQSYLDMDYSREPLYPLFLAGLRAVFGTAPSRYGADIPRYLVAAVLVQAVAMAVCVWYFVRVIGSTAVDARGEEWSSIGFRKAGGTGNASAGRSGEREGFRTFLLFSICWGVDLLNRFAARRGSMYMESIMTESFAIPLFLVFLACAYLFFRTHRPGRLIACTVLMFVLISLRKQMAVSAVILVCFSLLYDLIRRRRWKPFAACVLAAGIAFGGAALADYGYNELCLVLDSFYCLKQPHEIDRFAPLLWQIGYDEPLSSENAQDADLAFYAFLDYFLNDGHTYFNSYSWMAGDRELEGMDGSSTVALREHIKRYRAAREKL